MRGWLIAASAAVSIMACSATADTYRFDLVDPDARIDRMPLVDNRYTFFLNDRPAPISGSVTPLYFVVPTMDYFTVAGGGVEAREDAIAFFDGSFFGGLQTMFNQYEGERLFDGTTDQPVFRTGVFALRNGRSGATLTISMAEVPEPASWATMVAGFAAVGIALRARRRPATAPVGTRLAPRRARL